MEMPWTTSSLPRPGTIPIIIFFLLLLLSLKLPVVLVLVCTAVWVRNLCRRCSPRGNLQLPGASGSLHAPTVPKHPPAPCPLPHTLWG